MIDKILEKVKQKTIFSELDNVLIKNLINDIINENEHKFELLKKQEYPEESEEFIFFVKETRSILHEIYGIFSIKQAKRWRLLKNLELLCKKKKKIDSDVRAVHEAILKCHLSTLERINFYQRIYKNLFQITAKPKTILDLGSGINPLSFPFMGLKEVNYMAYEISNNEVRFLNKYFSIMKKFGLTGKACLKSTIKENNLPKSDLCFIFKTIDLIETLKRNYTKQLLKKIDANFFVISFPTRSVTGKTINKERLEWFFKLIKDYKTIETSNEIFYIIRKQDLNP